MSARSYQYGSLADEHPLAATGTGGLPSYDSEHAALRDIGGWWQAFARSRAADASTRQLDANHHGRDPLRRDSSTGEVRSELVESELWFIDHLEPFVEFATQYVKWPRVPVVVLLSLIGCVKSSLSQTFVRALACVRSMIELARPRALGPQDRSARAECWRRMGASRNRGHGVGSECHGRVAQHRDVEGNLDDASDLSHRPERVGLQSTGSCGADRARARFASVVEGGKRGDRS